MFYTQEEVGNMSKNERAESVMGRRPEGTPFDMPSELGYTCPICGPQGPERSEDERLDWSEYNGFLWCQACNIDIPSCFCIPFVPNMPEDKPSWVNDGIRDAINVYLDTVTSAVSRSKENNEG